MEKKWPLSLFMVTCLFICWVIPAFAAAEVSVTGGNWAIGNVGAGSVSTSGTEGRDDDKWTVTGSSDGTEDIYIKVTGVSWDPGSSAGADTFVLKHDVSGTWGSAITNIDNGILLIKTLAIAGTQKFDLQFTAPTSGIEDVEQTLTVTLTATNWWPCGSDLTVDHTAGDVAPVTKTVTYGTVLTNLTGSDKCWITRNLGASQQASSATDATEASAGWYWQFNRKQGYKHDGTTLTPAWTITSIDEASDWTSANDPCAIELGTGWRLPTNTEWNNADINGSWDNYTHTYNSVLKLHAAGYLHNSNGSLNLSGDYGYYWSSTQNNATNGWRLSFSSGASNMSHLGVKADGFSLRCLRY